MAAQKAVTNLYWGEYVRGRRRWILADRIWWEKYAKKIAEKGGILMKKEERGKKWGKLISGVEGGIWCSD
jgi:hypothetical protein